MLRYRDIIFLIFSKKWSASLAWVRRSLVKYVREIGILFFKIYDLAFVEILTTQNRDFTKKIWLDY
jgi:hypothetical protein